MHTRLLLYTSMFDLLYPRQRILPSLCEVTEPQKHDRVDESLIWNGLQVQSLPSIWRSSSGGSAPVSIPLNC